MDALAEVIHDAKVFFPFLIKHLQHQLLLHQPHVDAGSLPFLLLGRVVLADGIDDALAQRLFGEFVVVLQPLLYGKGGVELGRKRLLQAGHIPLIFNALGRDVFAHQIVHDLAAHLFDGVRDVLRLHQLVALLIDVVALIVGYVVELQQVLAGVEVLPFHAPLSLLDGTVDHAVFDGLALFQAQRLHEVAHPLRREDAHEIVFHGKEEARRTGVALAPGPAP